jgi:hypothetical protein
MSMAANDTSVPLTAVNRAQLSHIAYVADDFASVRERLLSRMAQTFPQWNPALESNIERPDFAVLFADLFAHLAGILNAYSDARVNESFLRTASLERSLIDLAALIDYRLSPGASAAGLQAFLVKEGATGVVPSAFKVQVPAAGDVPAIVFETLTSMAVASVRNRLRLYGYDRSSRVLRLRNSASAVQDREVLLDGLYRSLKPGVPLVLEDGSLRVALPLVASDELDGKTRVQWAAGAPTADRDWPIADLAIYGRPKQTMRLAAAARADELPANTTVLPLATTGPFSIGDAVLITSDGVLMPTRIIGRDSAQKTVTIGRGLIAALRRSATRVIHARHIGAVHTRLRPGATTITTASSFGGDAPEPGDYLLLSDEAGVELATVAAVDGQTIVLAQPLLRAMRPGVSFKSTPQLKRIGLHRVQQAALTGGTTVRPVRLHELSGVFQSETTILRLDRSYEELVPGGRVALSDGVRHSAHTISQVAVVDDVSQLVLADAADGQYLVSKLQVYAPFEYTMHVDRYNVSEATLPAGTSQLDIVGTGLGLNAGTHLIVDDADPTQVAQGVRITQVAEANGRTLASLARPLERNFVLGAAVVYGNVAPVRHGASEPEQVLGSGDPSVPNQRFQLSGSPVSFVPDSTRERGVAANVEIFVDGERWIEVDSLADSGPNDHHFVLEIDDEQRAFACLGDNVHGASAASGLNNIRVRSKTGIGTWANVTAGAVKQMPQPLPFVASTLNIAPTAGGADRETPATAKRRAAQRVRTLDRVVTLEDLADLALNFAGVAKTRAEFTRASMPGPRVVTVTVVGEGGAPLGIETKDALYAYLRARMTPAQALGLKDADRLAIKTALEVTLHANFLQSDVLRRLQAAFGSGVDEAGQAGYFNFDRRALGETLYLSEVYALAESVPGVDYVLATAFHPEGAAPAVLDRIAMPPNAWASGGDPVDASRGRLVLTLKGGLL